MNSNSPWELLCAQSLLCLKALLERGSYRRHFPLALAASSEEVVVVAFAGLMRCVESMIALTHLPSAAQQAVESRLAAHG